MVKLGRIPSHHDDRTLRFAKYVEAGELPAAPMARDWSHPDHAPRWGMFGNDKLGDCTCAAIAHAFQAAAANNDVACTIEAKDVIELYSEVGGYSSLRPETDQGCEMIDVLNEMRSGEGLAGEHIGAFMAVDPTNRKHVEAAINEFGWLYVGGELPPATETQTVWDLAPFGQESDPQYQPDPERSHAMAMLGYDALHDICISWGKVRIMTRRWTRRCITEAYAVMSRRWLDDTSMLTPSGFDLKQLMADLYEIDRNRNK